MTGIAGTEKQLKFQKPDQLLIEANQYKIDKHVRMPVTNLAKPEGSLKIREIDEKLVSDIALAIQKTGGIGDSIPACVVIFGEDVNNINIHAFITKVENKEKPKPILIGGGHQCAAIEKVLASNPDDLIKADCEKGTHCIFYVFPTRNSHFESLARKVGKKNSY